MDVRREHLQRAAAERTRTARAVLTGVNGGAPQTACYLMHTGLECALKLRLLKQSRVVSSEALRSRLKPDVFERLFQSRHGHDLETLASHATLPRWLEARRQRDLIRGRVWGRMADSSRPYSLRYGVEGVPLKDAEAELTLGESLVSLLLE